MRVLLFQTFLLTAFAQIYISPTSTCNASCSGSASQPYANLWQAMTEHQIDPTAEFILLNSPTSSHFLMDHQIFDSLPAIPYITPLSMVGAITLRPSFCTDSDAIANHFIPTQQCILPTQTLTIYMKTDQLTLNILGTLNMTGIIFDGTENIRMFNPTNPSNLEYCIYMPTFCCQSSGLTSNVEIGIICKYPGMVISSSSITQPSFIVVKQAMPTALLILNSGVNNTMFESSGSFIQIEKVGIFTLEYFTLTNSFFPNGFLTTSSSVTNNWGGSTIYISDLEYALENPLGLTVSPAITSNATFFSAVGVENYEFVLNNSLITSLIVKIQPIFRVSQAKVEIQLTNFINVEVNLNQEAMTFTGSQFQILNCQFTTNKIYGPFLSANGSSGMISNTGFSQNIINLNNEQAFMTSLLSGCNIMSNEIKNGELVQMIYSVTSNLVSDLIAKNNNLNNSILIGGSGDQIYSGINMENNQLFAGSSLISNIVSGYTSSSLSLFQGIISNNLFSSSYGIYMKNGISNIINSEFTSNNIEEQGSFAWVSGTEFSINNTIIFGHNLYAPNSYFQQGMQLFGTTGLFSNLTITGNIVNTESSSTQMAVVTISSSKLFVFDLIITNNTGINAETYFMYATSWFFSDGVLIANNTIQASGLFIKLSDTNEKDVTINMNNTELINNIVAPNTSIAQALYFKGIGTAVVFNITVRSNILYSTSSNPSTIFFQASQIGNFENIIIENNYAYNGESTNLVRLSSVSFITGLNVTGNQLQGTALQVNQALVLNNANIINNTLTAGNFTYVELSMIYLQGGAGFSVNNIFAINNTINCVGTIFYFYQSQGNIIGKGSFESNLLSNYGSLIMSSIGSGSNIYSAINFEFNSVSGNASLIVSSFSDNSTYDSCIFNNNNYEDFGGISLVRTTGYMFLVNNEFNDIKAIPDSSDTNGQSAIIVNSEGYLLISNCNFTSPHLISSFSAITIIVNSKFRIDNFDASQKSYSRKLILSFSSTNQIQNTEFWTTTGVTTYKDQLFKGISSNITFFQTNFTNLSSSSGFLFQMLGGTLNLELIEFTTCRITNTQAYFMDIEGASMLLFFLVNFQGQSPQISVVDTLNVSITETNFANLEQASPIMKIVNAETIFFTKLNIQLNHKNSEQTESYIINIEDPTYIVNLDQFSISGANTSMGALYINFVKAINNSIINIINSEFSGNNATGGGGGAITTSLSKCSLNIQNTYFASNTAFYLSSKNIGGQGGAIYLGSSGQVALTSAINIKNCTFLNNNASLFGGALYVYGVAPNLSADTIFLENFASGKGNSYGSYAERLEMYYINTTSGSGLEIATTTSSIEISGIASSQGFSKPFNFELKDIYNNTVYGDSQSVLTLTADSKSVVFTNILFRANAGVFNTSTLSTIAPPGSTHALYFKTNGVQRFSNVPNSQNTETNPDQITMTANFRDCIMGEIVTSSNACQQCSPQFYLINLETNAIGPCLQCEDNSMVCNGGSSLYPKNGYWRYNGTSDLILSCPESSACEATENPEQSESGYATNCSYGYQGPLCNTCIDGWGKDRNGVCFKCSEFSGQLIGVIGGALAGVVMICYTIYIELKQGEEYLKQKEDQDSEASQSILLRSLMNYLQMISLLGSIHVGWPNQFSSMVNVNEYLAFTKIDLANIDCFFTKHKDIRIQPTYSKLILANMGPFIFCISAVLFWILYFWIRRRSIKSVEFGNKITISIMIACFSLQPGTLNANLKMFGCQNVYRTDQQVTYLQTDYNIECWTQSHSDWAFGLSVPFIVFWTLILPTPVFLFMKKHKDELFTQEYASRYSFLYRGYKPSVYFWELLIFLRKYCLIFIASLTAFISNEMQIYMSLYVIWVALSLQHKYNPYSMEKLNFLESTSLICAAVMNSTGFYFKFLNSSAFLSYVFMIVAISANCYFLANWTYQYFLMKKKSRKESKEKDKEKQKVKNPKTGWSICWKKDKNSLKVHWKREEDHDSSIIQLKETEQVEKSKEKDSVGESEEGGSAKLKETKPDDKSTDPIKHSLIVTHDDLDSSITEIIEKKSSESQKLKDPELKVQL